MPRGDLQGPVRNANGEGSRGSEEIEGSRSIHSGLLTGEAAQLPRIMRIEPLRYAGFHCGPKARLDNNELASTEDTIPDRQPFDASSNLPTLGLKELRPKLSTAPMRKAIPPLASCRWKHGDFCLKLLISKKRPQGRICAASWTQQGRAISVPREVNRRTPALRNSNSTKNL